MTGKSRCEMRDAYIFERKFIGNESKFSLHDYWGLLFPQYKQLMQKQDVPTFTKKILAKESFGMSQPAAALSFTNMMNPHLFFFAPFFFALSISYLLVARVLPCSKPVGHIHVPAKGIIFHLYLRRLVLNKTHDREIALRNARMRIYFDANLWELLMNQVRPNINTKPGIEL